MSNSTRPYAESLARLRQEGEALEAEIERYERPRRKSGSYPSVAPVSVDGPGCVSSGPDRVTFRALLVELEVNLAGKANREAVIERGLRSVREQLDAHLAKCGVIDIEQEEPTQRWVKAI